VFACAACPAGYYKAADGRLQCVACDVGLTSNQTSVASTDCQAITQAGDGP